MIIMVAKQEKRLIIRKVGPRRSNLKEEIISYHKKRVTLWLQTPVFPPDSVLTAVKEPQKSWSPSERERKTALSVFFSWLKATSFQNKTEKRKKKTFRRAIIDSDRRIRNYNSHNNNPEEYNLF